MLRRLLVLRQGLEIVPYHQLWYRGLFSTYSAVQSGHNKWSSIKHDKGRNDAKKSKARTLILKDVSFASKVNGPDPGSNPKLAAAIALAKRAGTLKSSIEAAIARGQGKSSSGAALENVLIEAVLPPVAILIDCQTDSKTQTLAEVRHIIKQNGGTTTATKYLFEKRGRIVFQKHEVKTADDVLEAALEAGALDVSTDLDGRIVVDTAVEEVKATEKKLVEDTGLETASSDTTWTASVETRVDSLDQSTLQELLKLYEELQNYPGVEQIRTNLGLEHFPEDIRSRLGT